MRVPTNSNSDQMIDRISLLSYKQSKLQTQVSTGQRIFQPEDDPAAAARVLTLDAERTKLKQYATNASHANDISNATSSVMKQLKTISDRAGELATLGTGSMGTESFNTYATEMNQLVEQGLQLGNSKLGNDYLFSGTALSTASFTTTTTAGQIDSVTYAGNATALSISLSDNAAINPGSSIQTNHDIATFLNHLIDMRNAFTAKDSSALMTARDTIIGTDIAPGDEDNILSSMSELGAVQTRIEISNTQRTERLDNIESLVSNEVNVDMPETITKLNQTSTAYQAALQSAAMIMKTSLLDYIS